MRDLFTGDDNFWKEGLTGLLDEEISVSLHSDYPGQIHTAKALENTIRYILMVHIKYSLVAFSQRIVQCKEILYTIRRR